MSFEATYERRTGRSRGLFDRASAIIPAGAGSSARTFKFGWVPYPPFMAEGTGSRLRDVDGHEYVDYLLGLGPMILGHRHPAVTGAVAAAISDLGTCFGLPYELEIEAARKVVEAVPGVDSVTALRFSRQRDDDPLPSRPVTAHNVDLSYIAADRLEVLQLGNDPSRPEHGALRLQMGGGT